MADKHGENGTLDLEVMIDRCTMKDLIYIANRMNAFVESENYKILKLANWKHIRMMLASGKLSTESSDYRLGFMEGVQNGFETRIAELIDAGRKAEEQIQLSGDEEEEQIASLSGAEEQVTGDDKKSTEE